MTVPSLGWNYINSLRDESNELICTYKDEDMRWFVGQSIKVVGCTSFNQYFLSNIADKIFMAISEELNVKRNICGVIEADVKYMSKERNDWKWIWF